MPKRAFLWHQISLDYFAAGLAAIAFVAASSAAASIVIPGTRSSAVGT
jgi:hypothetical protein